MKAHIVTDAHGIVHNLSTTPINVTDISEMSNLLHGRASCWAIRPTEHFPMTLAALFIQIALARSPVQSFLSGSTNVSDCGKRPGLA